MENGVPEGWRAIDQNTIHLLIMLFALATMVVFLVLGIIARSPLAVVTLSIGIGIVFFVFYLLAAQERMFRNGLFREFEYPTNMEKTGRDRYDEFLSDFSTFMPNIKEHDFHFPLNHYYSDQQGYIFDDDERALIVISDGINTIDIYVTRYSLSYISQIESYFSFTVAEK